ncbi:hypothetical protein ASPCAL11756 [Aspergillus calidoustus]|uniref:RNA-directed DNA polymerase n=1 Tax=Aspergillus calidoustus TaxID=454130 RepID=A0A0U5GA18_ASPCI|nr:hypothetical protein ASPCAL11756 [Aspergillus calidoustus]
MIKRAVRIDNTLRDLRARKGGHFQHRSEYRPPRFHGGNNHRGGYRANTGQRFQPRNQGHHDPYGPQPMELDATLSKTERDRRQKENLCFYCGKSGHRMNECNQRKNKAKKPSQGSGRRQQLRANQEIMTIRATREADDEGARGHPRPGELSPGRARRTRNTAATTQSPDAAPRRRSVTENLRSAMRTTGGRGSVPPTGATVPPARVSWYDSVEQGRDTTEPPRQEPTGDRHRRMASTDASNNPQESNDRVRSPPPPYQQYTDESEAAQLQSGDISLHETSFQDQGTERTSGSYRNEATQHEPAQAMVHSFDPFVQRVIDPLDEDYGTQVEGPVPCREVPTEWSITPNQNPHQISKETAAKWFNGVLNDIIKDPAKLSTSLRALVTHCPHHNLTCWDHTSSTWREHTLQCARHPDWCQICGRKNSDYHEELERLSHKRLQGSEAHRPCDEPWCECRYRQWGHKEHTRLPWIVCHDDACFTHNHLKDIAKYRPKRPNIVYANNECPCRQSNCSCQGYQQHPEHLFMHWTKCYDDECLIHYEAKLGRYMPSRPRHEKAPNWKTVTLAATRQGRHLKLMARAQGKPVFVMIDSGATGNFISPRCMDRLRLRGVQKEEPKPISGLSGEELGPQMLTVESGVITLVVKGRQIELSLDVFPLGQYDIVLGIPWLEDHNPDIDWSTKTIRWRTSPQQQAPVGAGALRPASQRQNAKQPAGRLIPKGNHAALEESPVLQVLAATSRPSERVWLKEIPGWGTGMPIRYSETIQIDETDDSDGENGENAQALAATNTEAKPEPTIPEEYSRFQDLFQKPERPELPPRGPHDHTIPIKEGVELNYKRILPLNDRESRVLKEYIDDQLAKGNIRPSRSPIGHGVLFAPKKDGSDRLCVDYRPLNDATVKDRYPLPLIQEIQDKIQGAVWFTKFDITDAYYRIRIAEGEEWKTAFRTKFGFYEYLVMPFGLTNAPPTFQRFIDEVLKDEEEDEDDEEDTESEEPQEPMSKFALAYLDDILIFSKGRKQHVKHVKRVLRRIRKAKLRCKLKKCEFHVQETEFLGHWVTKDGLKPEASKVRAIREWPAPKNQKELQQFIGLLNYYRRYIDQYAFHMAPLFKLLRKEQKFEWEEMQQETFEAMKEAITTAPIMPQHNPELQTTLETDASDYAIGARMTQPGPDGRPRPVGFWSRKLTGPEMNYDIHDKELLAIVAAFKQWRVYLQGARHTVIVKSDHKNLTYFTTTKELTRRQARWAELLSQYDYKIEHCKGTENGQADALSRRPDYEDKTRQPQPAILRKNDDGTLGNNPMILAATMTLSGDMLHTIREAMKEDKLMQQILASTPGALEKDGVLHIKGLVYVPPALIPQTIREHHDAPVHGHFGIDKTCEHIARNYYFPNMRKKVERYINECETCLRDKPKRHAPYGKLQNPEVPQRPWEWITVDFVGPLPTTKQENDYLAVISDRLTKYIHLKATKTTMTAKEMATVFTNTVVMNHGVPKNRTANDNRIQTTVERTN